MRRRAAKRLRYGRSPSSSPTTSVCCAPGFRVILDAEPDITVVGEAADGYAAVDVVARRRPDVVLMDIRMPELDGLAAAERILADPRTPRRS